MGFYSKYMNQVYGFITLLQTIYLFFSKSKLQKVESLNLYYATDIIVFTKKKIIISQINA